MRKYRVKKLPSRAPVADCMAGEESVSFLVVSVVVLVVVVAVVDNVACVLSADKLVDGVDNVFVADVGVTVSI